MVLEEEEEKFTYTEIAITIVMTGAIASFFIVIPFLLTSLLPVTNIIFNIIEAGVRLILFLSYLILVSQWNEIHRVFQYHGAEHKSIHAYEKGE